ncbi:glutamine amidotransferase-related protein [Zhaonella formicivorans]|uniref:glutamine amidotransferase-related protein n=1 Tax=Zhaonella formicivorans TaxID=2528593 RepID=UPI001D1003B5|nr:gamma-glutamyl-gamma-aminobutyrate hydrolase family protein [Zhaonella formicivorans]
MLLVINNYVTNIESGRREMEVIGNVCRGLAGIDFEVMHFSKLHGGLLREKPEIEAVISGGYYDSYDSFDLDIFSGKHDFLKSLTVPFLGICGGMQHLVLAFGGSVRRVYYGNEEKGYCKVYFSKSNMLFNGLDNEFYVWQNHYCEIAELPEEFEILSSSKKCRVQAVQLKGKSVFGVQFHPEKFTREHQAGRRVLQNFLSLV